MRVGREEVIKGLEDIREDYEDMRCKISIAIIDDALALLKAQEAVKPTRYQEGRWFKTWRCGACGGTLVFRNGKDKPKYCTDCGRAVKWDG